jgi:hypothetical protein
VTPHVVIFTAIPFETRMARRLGLQRHPDRAGPGVPVFSGAIAGQRILLIETGIRAKRLAKLPVDPPLEAHTRVVSVGLAGGLDPNLPGSAVVTCREVRMGGDRFSTDDRLTDDLARSGATAIQALMTADTVLATRREKQAAYTRSGAQAVDMESGIIASWAEDRHLPFAVLRGISDPATSRVPRAVLGSTGGLEAVTSAPSLLLLALRALRARRRLRLVLTRACALREH